MDEKEELEKLKEALRQYFGSYTIGDRRFNIVPGPGALKDMEDLKKIEPKDLNWVSSDGKMWMPHTLFQHLKEMDEKDTR